jgi:hypothetical protein
VTAYPDSQRADHPSPYHPGRQQASVSNLRHSDIKKSQAKLFRDFDRIIDNVFETQGGELSKELHELTEYKTHHETQQEAYRERDAAQAKRGSEQDERQEEQDKRQEEQDARDMGIDQREDQCQEREQDLERDQAKLKEEKEALQEKGKTLIEKEAQLNQRDANLHAVVREAICQHLDETKVRDLSGSGLDLTCMQLELVHAAHQSPIKGTKAVHRKQSKNACATKLQNEVKPGRPCSASTHQMVRRSQAVKGGM